MSRPRNIAGPVVRGSDLWGRDREISELWRLSALGSVLLTGPRRHGKSSLMYALYDKPQPDFSVVMMDVEWVETPVEFLTAMTAELLAIDRMRQLIGRIRSVPSLFSQWVGSLVDEVGVGNSNVGELKIKLRERLTNGEQWPELADQALRTLKGLSERVIFVLDEFPIMVGNMLDRDVKSGQSFLRWFRTFRQSPGTEKFSFLLGGSLNIEPRLESLGAEALLGDLQRFRIMPFDSGRALVFVRLVLEEEGAAHDPGVPEEVLAVCRSGVPYYLQVTLQECLAESRLLDHALTIADVRRVYEERVIGPANRHRFSHYQTRLRLHYSILEEPARLVLKTLCRGPKTVDGLRRVLLVAGADPEVLDRTLVRLEGDYYVQRDGEAVTFGDGVLRDWWSRNSVKSRKRA